MRLKSHWWWDHTTKDFSAMDMSRMVAVLPVGAVEQHGPHLPVRVDAAINAGIIAAAVEQMADDLPCLVLPMCPVGKSDEHLAYPGTLTLSAATLAALWFEIAASVHRAGCRRLLFVNSHGGQPQVMEMVCRRLRVELNMLAVAATWNRFTEMADLYEEAERKHGIHAGEEETSVMLHLHGDLVDMREAQNFVPISVEIEAGGGMLTPEGRIGFGWQMQDLHPSGAAGNAGAADAERGRVTVERAAKGLLRLIDEVADFPLDTFKPGPLDTNEGALR